MCTIGKLQLKTINVLYLHGDQKTKNILTTIAFSNASSVEKHGHLTSDKEITKKIILWEMAIKYKKQFRTSIGTEDWKQGLDVFS